MRNLILILAGLFLLVVPSLAFTVHVVDENTGHSVSVARVEIWQGGEMLAWGYTDNSGNYRYGLGVEGTKYLIKASSYNEYGSGSIVVDPYTNSVTVGIS